MAIIVSTTVDQRWDRATVTMANPASNTRSQSAPKTPEQLADYELFLRAEESRLQSQSLKLEENRNKLSAEYEHAQDNLKRERERWISENAALREELESLRNRKTAFHDDTVTDRTPESEMNRTVNTNPGFEATAGNSGITMNAACNAVPDFDGTNLPVWQFTRACHRARDLVPSHAEFTLTKLIINKLRGRAYTAIEDKPVNSVASLCNRLKDIFGPSNTIDHYRGEMANIRMRESEHILEHV